jgi:hypothetical protein
LARWKSWMCRRSVVEGFNSKSGWSGAVFLFTRPSPRELR